MDRDIRGYFTKGHKSFLTTGKFRGWLCMRYNFALGLVKDNIETLYSLAEYLKKNYENN